MRRGIWQTKQQVESSVSSEEGRGQTTEQLAASLPRAPYRGTPTHCYRQLRLLRFTPNLHRPLAPAPLARNSPLAEGAQKKKTLRRKRGAHDMTKGAASQKWSSCPAASECSFVFAKMVRRDAIPLLRPGWRSSTFVPHESCFVPWVFVAAFCCRLMHPSVAALRAPCAGTWSP